MKQNKFLSTQIFLGLLIVLVIGLGFNYFFKPFLYKFQTQIDPASLVARQDIPGAGTLGNGLLANLTTEQTIAQLLVLPIFPSSTGDLPDEIATWLKNYQPGFVQLRSMRTSSESADIKPVSLINAQRLIKQITDISKSFTWPSIMMTNFSGGLTELKGEGFVTIPAMKTLCATPDKAEPAIASAAAQLKKLGISMVIGPVVDLNQAAGANGLCSDPQTVVLGSKNLLRILDLKVFCL